MLKSYYGHFIVGFFLYLKNGGNLDMLEKLNQQMGEIKEKVRMKQKLQSRLERVKSILAEEKSQLQQLQEELKKEEKDVEKLEGLSLTGLFHAVLGDKLEKIEKEKQEFIAAQLKYDHHKQSVSEFEKELEEIKEALKPFENLDRDYQSMIKAKMNFIMQRNDANTDKLMILTERVTDLQHDIKELEEAIEAGDKAEETLEKMKKSLNSAENLGVWDMLGGGLLVTAAKHSNINDAKELAYEVQHSLEKFQHELKDIKTKTKIELNFSSFGTFADYFFDGLIADWFVQSKISNSLKEVTEVNEQITQLLSTLQRRMIQTEEAYEKTKQEINALIEGA